MIYAVKGECATKTDMASNTEDSATRQQLEVIGEHIRQLRTSRRFSQVGLAVRAGFTGAYYSAIERGKLNVSIINMVKVAKALGVEVGALFPPISILFPSETDEEGEEGGERDEGKGDGREKGSPGLSDPEKQSYSPLRSEQPQLEGKGEPERLLSAGATADRLSVNLRTVERWVRDGILLPAARVEDQRGKLYSVFRQDDIDQLAQDRRGVRGAKR